MSGSSPMGGGAMSPMSGISANPATYYPKQQWPTGTPGNPAGGPQGIPSQQQQPWNPKIIDPSAHMTPQGGSGTPYGPGGANPTPYHLGGGGGPIPSQPPTPYTGPGGGGGTPYGPGGANPTPYGPLPQSGGSGGMPQLPPNVSQWLNARAGGSGGALGK